MDTTVKLTKDENGLNVDPTLYRSMIGNILYLTASCLDIRSNVRVCARYQANPKKSHLAAVKRITCYVNVTVDSIYHSKDTNVNLVGFCDTDWASNTDDKKSTSGDCFFYLGNNLISWNNKNQNSISLSIAVAKYIAVRRCCTQFLWMKQMLEDSGIVLHSLTLFDDDKSAINISKNPIQHSRTKYKISIIISLGN